MSTQVLASAYFRNGQLVPGEWSAILKLSSDALYFEVLGDLWRSDFRDWLEMAIEHGWSWMAWLKYAHSVVNSSRWAQKCSPFGFSIRYWVSWPGVHCKGLDNFDAKVRAAAPKAEAMSSYRFPDNLEKLLNPLVGCAAESEKLNSGKPLPEFARAYHDLWELTSWEQLSDYNQSVAARGARSMQAYNEQPLDPNESQWRKALAGPSGVITLGPQDRLSESDLSQVSGHNRRLCDQVITVAGLTPNGLALYIPPEGQHFMAKNSQNYSRMCLVQDAESFVPGVPHYLLVWAYSEGAFAGFQPVRQVTTSPCVGSA